MLVKDPSNLNPGKDIYKHYKSVRSAYFTLQAELTDVLELAQSGLVLATYDHASGYIEQAYATIWTCIRMMHSLRLGDKFKIGIDSDHDKLTEYAKAHALWWAIFIEATGERFLRIKPVCRESFAHTLIPLYNMTEIMN